MLTKKQTSQPTRFYVVQLPLLHSPPSPPFLIDSFRLVKTLTGVEKESRSVSNFLLSTFVERSLSLKVRVRSATYIRSCTLKVRLSQEWNIFEGCFCFKHFRSNILMELSFRDGFESTILAGITLILTFFRDRFVLTIF
jgi:hypothetical protein